MLEDGLEQEEAWRTRAEGLKTKDFNYYVGRWAATNSSKARPALVGGLAGKLDETNTPQMDGPNSPASGG